MADIYKTAARFRQSLLLREQRSSGTVAAAYRHALTGAQAELDSLLKEIASIRTIGQIVGSSWVYQRKERLQRLMLTLEAELSKWAHYAAGEMRTLQGETVDRGFADAAALIREQIIGLDLSVSTNIGTLFASDAVESFVGFASDGSPLAELFEQVGRAGAQAVKDKITTGMILGKGAREIARDVRDAFDGSSARALTVVRTETMRAYREASRRLYEENSDVLDGWTWQASLSSRTCAMCWAMSGTKHAADEILASHPNCRCVMIPLVTGVRLEQRRGEDEFEQLSAEDQQTILGQKKFAAYQEGKLQLADLIGVRRDRRWGLTRFEKSLNIIQIDL